MSYIEQAIEILQKTNDGEELAPPDLALIQAMVNGNIFGVSEKMEESFSSLLERVRSGSYRPPWLHGVENLTIDHQGFVYWKGKNIEHFNFPFAYSEKGKTASIELERRCKALEAAGKMVCTNTVIWQWED